MSAIIESTKPQLHYSALETLWKCGVMFEQRYVLNRRVPPSITLHVGKGVDEAANTNLSHKITNDTLLPVEEVLDIARDTVANGVSAEGLTVEKGETESQVRADGIDKAVRLTKAHATILAPILKPARVQAKWSIEIDGMPFDVVGTRDLDETDGRIRDLKTSKRSANKDAADRSDQLTTYALSKFVIDKTAVPVQVSIDTIADLKRETKVQTLHSERDRDDFQVIIRRIENAATILEKGAFTPARETDWWCSTQYCGYAASCPYFRKPKSIVIDEGA
jgi:hypothetical protein